MSGHAEIWASLKTVVDLLAEGDIPTAQSILNAAAITVPTGDLKAGAYDENGNLYHLPEHIISDPQNVILDDLPKEQRAEALAPPDDEEEIDPKREEKGKGVSGEEEELVRVRARLSDRGGPDVVVQMGRKQHVRTVVRRVQEAADVSTSNDGSSSPVPLLTFGNPRLLARAKSGSRTWAKFSTIMRVCRLKDGVRGMWSMLWSFHDPGLLIDGYSIRTGVDEHQTSDMGLEEDKTLCAGHFNFTFLKHISWITVQVSFWCERVHRALYLGPRNEYHLMRLWNLVQGSRQIRYCAKTQALLYCRLGEDD